MVRPVGRGELEDTSMANRVEAPGRKELANSPAMPKLMESGFYTVRASKFVTFQGVSDA